MRVGMLGFRGKLGLNDFFTLKFGLRLDVEYSYLWNYERDLKDAGFTTVDTLQFLLLKLGLVFRFESTFLENSGFRGSPSIKNFSCTSIRRAAVYKADRGIGQPLRKLYCRPRCLYPS